MGRTSIVLFAALAGAALAAACTEDPPVGTLELHWSINGDETSAACSSADVGLIRVLADHTGADTDDNPLDPTWDYVDLECSERSGQLTLDEGVYRIRIVALGASNTSEIRSQIIDILGVEVIDGVVTSIPLYPDQEPPIDIEVAICGDGIAQSTEPCDASDLADRDCLELGYDSGQLACAADCTLDESGCVLAERPLTIQWTMYQSDATTLADCAALGISGVDVSVTEAGVGTVLHAETADCTALQTVVPDLEPGLLTVTLSGRNSAATEVAHGSSAVIDHSGPTGTTVPIDLIALP